MKNKTIINIFNRVIKFPLTDNVVLFGDIGTGKSILGKILAGIVHEKNLNLQTTLNHSTWYLDLTQKIDKIFLERNLKFLNSVFDDYKEIFEKYGLKKNNFNYLTNGQETFLNIFLALTIQAKNHGYNAIYFDNLETGLSLLLQQEIVEDILSINEKNNKLNIYISTNSPEVFSIADHRKFKVISLNEN